MRRMSDRLDPKRVGDTPVTGSNSQVGIERGVTVQEDLSSNPTRDIFLNGQYNLTEMIWSKGVENRLTTSIIS